MKMIREVAERAGIKKRRNQGGIYKDREYTKEKKVRRILKKYRRSEKEEIGRELITARS